jgi:S-DNA-T family DNA segregation ATPase FtsK/SpoIIIE
MKILSFISDERKKEILGVLLIALALFIFISLFTYDRQSDLKLLQKGVTFENFFGSFSQKVENQCGPVGAWASYLLFYALGYSSFFVPIFLILFGVSRFPKVSLSTLSKKILFVFIFVLVSGILVSLPISKSGEMVDFSGATLGGWVSLVLGEFCLKLFGTAGSYTLLIASLIILIAIITPLKPSDFFFLAKQTVGRLFSQGSKWRELRRIQKQRKRREKELKAKEKLKKATSIAEEPSISKEGQEFPEEAPSIVQDFKATLKLVRGMNRNGSYRGEEEGPEGDYILPSLDLLDDSPYLKSSVSGEELNQTAKVLRETLATFGVEIEADRIEKYPGPIITRYEFKPAAGIKVNQVVNLADDLALAMRARKVRIVAPVPGKAAIGVEIPNRNPQMVYLKEILSSSASQDAETKLAIAIGKTTSGEPFVTDLGKMPHLLIAGATGSGKSVCINAITTSLLYRLPPEEIRFIMIDPKMLELSVYDGIPHLERSVITNSKNAEHVLSEIVIEMEERYRKLAKGGVRNIEDFNAKQRRDKILPYLIIIVDELADLMMSSSNRTEALVTRLAQMARAVGIHLILATQRPSVDVITGLIKANFSARIAFQVASKIDSRTILDVNGAEKLLGAGDMLFIQPGHPEPRRIHGAFVSGRETQRIVDFIKAQNYEVEPIRILSAEPIEMPEEEKEKDEDLFRQAVELVIRHKQGSVSLLQRRLAVGYQRAARLIDQLEEEGIVGPYDGSKAREVLADETYLETEEWTKRKVHDKN